MTPKFSLKYNNLFWSEPRHPLTEMELRGLKLRKESVTKVIVFSSMLQLCCCSTCLAVYSLNLPIKTPISWNSLTISRMDNLETYKTACIRRSNKARLFSISFVVSWSSGAESLELFSSGTWKLLSDTTDDSAVWHSKLPSHYWITISAFNASLLKYTEDDNGICEM